MGIYVIAVVTSSIAILVAKDKVVEKYEYWKTILK